MNCNEINWEYLFEFFFWLCVYDLFHSITWSMSKILATCVFNDSEKIPISNGLQSNFTSACLFFNFTIFYWNVLIFWRFFRQFFFKVDKVQIKLKIKEYEIRIKTNQAQLFCFLLYKSEFTTRFNKNIVLRMYWLAYLISTWIKKIF